jgi:hydroxymethylbilane synthase
MLPALNQGIMAVQFRADDQPMRDILQTLVDSATYAAWLAERTVAEILEGDCKSAIASFAECSGETLMLSATVMLPDGSESISTNESGTFAEAQALGQTVGHRLLQLGAKQIIEKSRGNST